MLKFCKGALSVNTHRNQDIFNCKAITLCQKLFDPSLVADIMVSNPSLVADIMVFDTILKYIVRNSHMFLNAPLMPVAGQWIGI